MKRLAYSLDTETKRGAATLKVDKPHPIHSWYRVTLVTNVRVWSILSRKGYSTHSTHHVQYCNNKDAAKKEYKRQQGRLEQGGWVRKVVSHGSF